MEVAPWIADWILMVSDGIRWYFAIEQYSLVFNGIAWYLMVFQAITQYLMVFNNIRWYCMVFDGIACYYMVFIDISPCLTLNYLIFPQVTLIYIDLLNLPKFTSIYPDACSNADCYPLLTICPRCCPRHAPDDVIIHCTIG